MSNEGYSSLYTGVGERADWLFNRWFSKIWCAKSRRPASWVCHPQFDGDRGRMLDSYLLRWILLTSDLLKASVILLYIFTISLMLYFLFVTDVFFCFPIYQSLQFSLHCRAKLKLTDIEKQMNTSVYIDKLLSLLLK